MNIKKLFPLSANVVPNDSKTLVFAIVIYLIVCAVVKIADFLLGWVPLLGMILGHIFWVIGLYCAVGVIVAVLEYFRGND